MGGSQTGILRLLLFFVYKWLILVFIIINIIINAKSLCILVQNIYGSNHGIGGPFFFAFFDDLELNYTSFRIIRFWRFRKIQLFFLT